MKIEVMPVIIGDLGVMMKGIEKLIIKIPGDISLQEIRKRTLLGTAPTPTKGPSH